MRSQSTSLRLALIIAGVALTALGHPRAAISADRPPNFVVILCDNLGYGDIGCFGSTRHRTPHVDRMAREGMRLTSFYSTSGVCTPSRASLMTGCYPRRVNMHVDSRGGAVLRPVSPKGLNPDELTIAEVLKQRDYATALVGKWHLGDQPPFLPTRQGFDFYYGIPYSDDMTPREGQPWPPLPLMTGEQVVEAPADRHTLTRRYTEQAVEFIAGNRERPFFLLLSHAMPGSTRQPFASERFRGRSANGPYGDAVEEIDWSTGEVLETLERLGLDENTLVLWTSDNGAPRREPPQGSNGPLRGRGYTATEAGMRVPCVVRWPGRVPPGTGCDDLATMMDLLPTFARLADAPLPRDRIVDGRDIWPLLSGRPGAKSPHEALFYYDKAALRAVRSGKWKLQLASNEADDPQLFDLGADLRETRNLADKHPAVVKRLLSLAAKAREDLGDGEHGGKNQRPAGSVGNPSPRVLPPRVPDRK